MNIRLTAGNMHACRICVPASKSVSHRALIAASLAEGVSVVKNLSLSRDIKATVQALTQLGADIEINGRQAVVQGTGGVLSLPDTPVDCYESGSTLRFLIPLCMRDHRQYVFTGQGRLMERPLSVYEKICADQNLLFEKKDRQLFVRGPLREGKYTVEGNVSSQFVSGLLFALPLLEKDSEIDILPPLQSASYVRLSEQTLKTAGIHTCRDGMRILIPGSQKYRAFQTEVEGDDSQAAVFAVLALLAGIPITVPDMNHDSSQADHVITDYYQRFGGQIAEEQSGYTFYPGSLHAFEADLGDCPDLGPVLFTLAACAPGESVFRNTARLRYKESDRIAAMEEELRKTGCQLITEENIVRIRGGMESEGNYVFDAHNDHRVAMALSLLAAHIKGSVTVKGAEAVEKSWPDFFEQLAGTGMNIEYEKEYSAK